MNGRHLLTILLLISPIFCTGCRSREEKRPDSPPTVYRDGIFADVTERAGVRFLHDGGLTGKFRFIENTPPGCAFLDYDGDGWLDILLVQSGSSDPFDQVKDRPHCALFHNKGDGTFEDVTAGSGLDADLGYGQGVTVGDFDNDGFPDVLITGYDRCHLFHNEHGSGKYVDVTERMGLGSLRGYFTSAAFGDYDNDGKLDLYICRYTPWDWKSNVLCHSGDSVDYCNPQVYETSDHVLLHNEGTRFRDVSEPSGILKKKGRGLGIAFLDYNGDGKQDIFVANDMSPNMLWRNNGDGTFTDVAVEAGCAYDGDGQIMAGMGIALADYDHSGRDSLFIGNFSGKPNVLLKNIGNGLFQDASYSSGVALPHMQFLTFGTEFLDYDRDGFADLIVVNGHVQVHAGQKMDGVTYEERKQLFRNQGDNTFAEITDPAQLGPLAHPTVGRGVATGDFDNDGRMDILVANQGGHPELLQNRSADTHHWISLLPVGVRSNREGRHARFLLSAGGVTQTATVRAGSSYLSASDRRVFFGLADKTKVERVEIRWPSGTTDILTSLAVDQGYVVTEGKGITGKQPSRRAPTGGK